jgi:hypothetical protein
MGRGNGTASSATQRERRRSSWAGPMGQRERREEATRSEGITERGKYIVCRAPLACGPTGPVMEATAYRERVGRLG